MFMVLCSALLSIFRSFLVFVATRLVFLEPSPTPQTSTQKKVGHEMMIKAKTDTKKKKGNNPLVRSASPKKNEGRRRG